MKAKERSEVKSILNNSKYSKDSVTCNTRQFHATVQAVAFRPLTAKTRAPSQANLCGPRFSPRTSVSSCQCHSTNASHSFTDLSPKLIILTIESIVTTHVKNVTECK
jgi:hypothetical protein